MLALPLSIEDLNPSVCLPECGFSHLYQKDGELGNNGYLASLLWGIQCTGVCKSAQRLAHHGAAAGVPSHPPSQQGLGKAPWQARGRGRRFLRGRLLLGAFKSFSRGSCLCIRAAADAEPRAGGSEQAPETQAPTHSLNHTRRALGGCLWGAGLCTHTQLCARVCSRVWT